MARTIWTGAVSFGLVNVPVRLYSAVQSRSLSFRQLSGKDQSRVRQKRVSETTGEEVAYEDLVKGYEIAPDQYVVIEPEELDALDPEGTRTIDIEDFVDLEEIDPIYFDRPYYLGPAAESAAKPYRLLVEAMEKSGKVAIARFVMRSKEYLAALRVKDGMLVLSTMNYHDEIVPVSEIDGIPGEDEIEVKDREIEMARQLIDSLASAFEPERYEDEYRQRVLELIEAKAAGEEIVLREAPEEGAEVVDLMAALEESIESAKRRKQEAG
ncbi:MAG: Ku protein [Nitriliruptorales bacterium]